MCCRRADLRRVGRDRRLEDRARVAGQLPLQLAQALIASRGDAAREALHDVMVEAREVDHT